MDEPQRIGCRNPLKEASDQERKNVNYVLPFMPRQWKHNSDSAFWPAVCNLCKSKLFSLPPEPSVHQCQSWLYLFVFLFKSIVFTAEYLRPFVVAVAFLWKWNNNWKNPTAHRNKQKLTSLSSHSATLSSIPSPYRSSPESSHILAKWSFSCLICNIPDTFVHSKYWKLHQAARWFYRISPNTEPTVNIRLQKISIPGKHGYEPDSGHDPKIGFTEQVAGLRLKIPNYCSLSLFFFFFLIMSTGCLLFL